LTDRESEKLAHDLVSCELDEIDLPRRFRKTKRRVTVELTAGDSARIVDATERMLARLPKVVASVVNDTTERVFRTLKATYRPEFSRAERSVAGFRMRLRQRWGKPIRLLKLLVGISRELGEHVNVALRQEPGERPHLIEVVTRLHARSCSVGEEVIALLEGGFADGAMARWRTLHEIAVTASFICEHGEELAERYMLHQVVESKRAMDAYATCQPKLGYEPLTDAEVDATERAFAAVIARFDEEFGKPYGWAVPHLQHPKNAKFDEIERTVGLGHMRAHYKLASHGVHANPKGIFFRLGLLREEDVLLVGASDAGFADPGHSTAISVLQTSATLGLLRPTIDNLVALKVMMKLVDEIGETFAAAAARLQ
jgi:hypothetical protein